MQENDALDFIPQKVESGRMTAKEAAMRILEEIYTNPGRFNLLDMDEDERSDFLLGILPKLQRIVQRYDKSLGPLGAYVFYSLPGFRLTWERKKYDMETAKRGARASVRSIYEDSLERRPMLVSEPRVAEPPVRLKKSEREKEEAPLIFRRIFNRRERFVESKKTFLEKRAAVALALKSAWYIDDSTVKRLSAYCGCPSDCFAETVEKIRSLLLKKNERRLDLEKRRDKAWFFICKYRERLAGLEPNSNDWRKIKRKLEYQLASWKHKNAELSRGGMQMAPKISELARILRVHPNRISLFLKYAKKMEASGETALLGDLAEEDL